jgi:hypothetical protein
MGLQLETAGRGTLAVYTSVCPLCSHYLNDCIGVLTVILHTDYLRRYLRVRRLPYFAASSLDYWDIDNHEFVHIHYRNLTSIPFCLSSAHIPVADKEENRH